MKNPDIEQKFYFDKEGWSILAGVEEVVIDAGIESVQTDGQIDLAGYKSIIQYRFYAIGTDREFYVSRETLTQSRPCDPCWCSNVPCNVCVWYGTNSRPRSCICSCTSAVC